MLASLSDLQLQRKLNKMKTTEQIAEEAADFVAKISLEQPHLIEAAVAAYIEGYNKATEDFTNKYKYLIN